MITGLISVRFAKHHSHSPYFQYVYVFSIIDFRISRSRRDHTHFDCNKLYGFYRILVIFPEQKRPNNKNSQFQFHFIFWIMCERKFVCGDMYVCMVSFKWFDCSVNGLANHIYAIVFIFVFVLFYFW